MKGRESLILHASVQLVFPVAVVFSIYLLFAGHNAPGGGFVAALVMGAAFVLRYIDGGLGDVERALPISPFALAGIGLTIAVLAGGVSLLVGAPFLTSDLVSLDVPLIGTVKASSTLVFDIGVYLVVTGLVVGELHTLGAEES